MALLEIVGFQIQNFLFLNHSAGLREEHSYVERTKDRGNGDGSLENVKADAQYPLRFAYISFPIFLHPP